MEREYDQLQEKMSKISKLLRIVALFLILKEFSLALGIPNGLKQKWKIPEERGG